MAVYAGMLEYMDMSIGRVIDHLKSKGMLDNTVVVFLSDNGGEAAKLIPLFPEYYRKNFDLSYEHLGEKGSYSEYGPGWASASMTPFSNYKGSAAEGGVRAPFIIRYPRVVPPGGRSDAFAYVLDVVPTLLDLAGVSPPPDKTATLGGRSMVDVLSGKAEMVHPATESISYEVAGGAAVYHGDYKLVRSPPPYGDSKWRLYDVRTDPTESHDLTATQPELAAQLIKDFAAYRSKNGVVEVPSNYDVFSQAQANFSAKN
jgi:arylsulfatase